MQCVQHGHSLIAQTFCKNMHEHGAIPGLRARDRRCYYKLNIRITY